MTKPGVYTATKEELAEVVAFIVKIPVEQKGFTASDIPVSFEKVFQATIDTFLNGQIFLYRNKLNKIVGCLYLVKEELWWSDRSMMHDLAFHTIDDGISRNVSKELLLAAKAYAKLHNVPLLVSVYTNDKVSLKQRFLNMLGFKTVGFFTRQG